MPIQLQQEPDPLGTQHANDIWNVQMRQAFEALGSDLLARFAPGQYKQHVLCCRLHGAHARRNLQSQTRAVPQQVVVS